MTESNGTEETNYIKSPIQHLSVAYDLAVEASRKTKGKHNKQYDKKARPAVLQPDDLVLVCLLAFQGKNKLSNRWEKEPYTLLSVNLTRQYQRTIHRNLPLPLGQLPHDTQPPTPVQPENDLQHSSEHDELEVGPTL